MLCSISGEPTEEPVVSKVSGRVYEQRIAVAYIAERGTDPVTGEASTVDDLISIQGYTPVAKPRTAALTSIPALLGALQTEWDALALESFQLKQQLQQHKQELSSALYHHDAAVRVAARLQKERDEARQSLADLSASLGVAVPSSQPASRAAQDDNSNNNDEQNGEPMDTTAANGDEKLSAEWVSKIENKSNELRKWRKGLSKDQSVVAAEAATETVQQFAQVAATKQLFANNQTLSIREDQVLTGGAKSQFGVYSVAQNEVTLSGKAGGIVTCGAWVPESETFVLGLKTGGVELYSGTDLVAKDAPFGKHAIVDITVLAAGIVAVAAGGGGEQKIAFYSADSLEHLYTTNAFDDTVAAVAAHPDGELLAVAAGNTISVLNVPSNEVVLTLPNTASAVQHLSFSENGYFLAYSDADTVSVYHLGKEKTVHESSASGDIAFGGALGNYLLVDNGDQLEVHKYDKSSKQFAHLTSLEKEGNVKRIGWTAAASHAVVVTDKGKIVVYGQPSDS